MFKRDSHVKTSTIGTHVKHVKTRIYIFFGTRPEVIKLSPIIQKLRTSQHFELKTVFTGQQPDLIKPFLQLFEIKVDVDFIHVMTRNQSLPQLISKIMTVADKSISHRPSDIWMIQGDTSTAYAIATVAFHHGLRIAHVEAGLRTYNMYSPFPEEFNRRSIAPMATFHFAPTQNNRLNLLNEGVADNTVFVTGNTVVDSVKYLHLNNKTRIPESLINITWKEYIPILITMHRRENFPFMPAIYKAIQSVKCLTCLFIIPLHSNPSASNAARNICTKDTRFHCIPALAYEELHWVLVRSQAVLTDSGGLQEEATWYPIPSLILRDSTERPEVVTAHCGRLVGTDTKTVMQAFTDLLSNNKTQQNQTVSSKCKPPYGYGNASEQIIQILINHQKFPVSNAAIKMPCHSLIQELQTFNQSSVGVVLQVYKRNSLEFQLDTILQQTLVPSSVIVLQNGFHVDVSKTIQDYREKYRHIELQHIASSKNLRYHGRFHMAYMMKEDYVSVWDDDMLPKSQWLQYSIEYSRKNNNALVGANGRTFVKIDETTHKVIERWNKRGVNDFVGHIWTLPRVFLRYFIESGLVTEHTGEDIQLAFALQKHGIKSMRPPTQGKKVAKDMKDFFYDKHAASRTNQSPRQLLFCQLFQAGFETIECKNCRNSNLIDKCIEFHKPRASNITTLAEKTDREENKKISWKSIETLNRTNLEPLNRTIPKRG